MSLKLSEMKMMVGLSRVTTTLDSHLVWRMIGALGTGLGADMATLLNLSVPDRYCAHHAFRM